MCREIFLNYNLSENNNVVHLYNIILFLKKNYKNIATNNVNSLNGQTCKNKRSTIIT